MKEIRLVQIDYQDRILEKSITTYRLILAPTTLPVEEAITRVKQWFAFTYDINRSTLQQVLILDTIKM